MCIGQFAGQSDDALRHGARFAMQVPATGCVRKPLQISPRTGPVQPELDPMLGSTLVRDPKFTDRVVAETRALLSTIPA